MKKKEYIRPEMEIFELKNQQTLLTGSLGLGEEFQSGDPVLAPGMEDETEIIGLPSFLFE